MTKHILIAALLSVAATAASAETSTLNQGHLDILDKDGDGAVSKSEYYEFATFAFNTMDTNNNATLSPAEVDEHLVSDRFAEMDKNGDGAVTPEEFALQLESDFRKSDIDGDNLLN